MAEGVSGNSCVKRKINVALPHYVFFRGWVRTITLRTSHYSTEKTTHDTAHEETLRDFITVNVTDDS